MASSDWYVDISSGWRVDANSMAAFLLPGVLIPLVLLVLAFLQPTKRQMNRWAAVCGVTLTEANREQVRSHLARGRRFRSMAAFPFWWLGSIRVIYAPFPDALASIVPAMAAYLGGALLAELTGGGAKVPASAPRRAALLTRTMDDYAHRWVRKLPYVLLATGVLSVAWTRFRHAPGPVTKSEIIVSLATVFAGGALLVGRTIVRRPQRGDEPDVLAADDGLRATAISTAHAAGALAGLYAAWTGLGSLIPTDGWSWWLLVLVLPATLAANGLGIGLVTVVVRQETWGYRRRHRQVPTAAITLGVSA